MLLFSITEIMGHFHPVLVHLPIGILLLAVLMQLLSAREKFLHLQPAITFTYLAGASAAILSCISGWMLASGGGYEEETLFLHRWMGISVAVISTGGYYFSMKGKTVLLKWSAVVLLVIIVITGHLGGTLTHGEGYLTKTGISKSDSVAVIKPIANAQEAVVYNDIIQPILDQKCYSCHAATKQKGGLRLDEQTFMLKGGKSGPAVIAGNPESSELYKRVILDPLEEKHMPPKGKPQLSEQDRILLHWWISAGLNFTAKAKELEQPPAIKAALTSLQKTNTTATSDVPLEPVDKAPDSILVALHAEGITILPVAMNSNYLTANFVTVKEISQKDIDRLLLLKKQLVWLKMPGIQLSPTNWKQLASLTQLTRLSIEHSNITDENLAFFSSLTQLQYLNVVDTKLTLPGLLKLKWPQLTNIYVGQTLAASDITTLQKNFPKAKVDRGDYKVESLATDTEVVRKKS